MKNTIKSALVVSAIGAALVSTAGVAAAQDAPYPPGMTTTPVVSATVQVAGTVITMPSKPVPQVAGAVETKPAPQVAGIVATKPAAEAQGQLAYTGADVLPYGVGGGVLVLLGAGALVLGRKRRD